AQPRGDLGLGQVPERVHDSLRAPGLEDARIAVAERGDAEAAGQIQQLAPVAERDAAALRALPDHPGRITRARARARRSTARSSPPSQDSPAGGAASSGTSARRTARTRAGGARPPRARSHAARALRGASGARTRSG